MFWSKNSLGQKSTKIKYKKLWVQNKAFIVIGLEAATMYKLKGQSSNMRTDQGFT